MTDVKAAMGKTSTRILEDWAMMMVDPEALGPQLFDPEQPCHVATAKFEGVINGSFYVVCQKSFVDALTMNLLGDEERDERSSDDALREMVNVFAGNLLTESFGTDTVFNISPPVSFEESDRAALAKILDPARSFAYRGDGAAVAISFAIELFE